MNLRIQRALGWGMAALPQIMSIAGFAADLAPLSTLISI
jgi:hypothetical protein